MLIALPGMDTENKVMKAQKNPVQAKMKGPI
jgi:hypothetical protein